MELIRISDLDFSYKIGGRKVDVLRKINLRIDSGEMVAIQGSSGSGKSTLLYILGCLLRPDQGSVHFGGQDVSKLSNEQLASLRNSSIGFVFQQFHLLARASVLENILLPSQYSGGVSAHGTALGLAEQLGLSAHLTHFPNQLSGGQQQRVAIARALLGNPQVILADEPTGNLDSKNAALTMDLLKELNRQGKTIIIITHDPEIARGCGKIHHIRDGSFTHTEDLTSSPVRAASSPMVRTDRASAKLEGAVRTALQLLPLAWSNLSRNKARSFLTLLGITIGIASVLAMITVGQFTKSKILQSYESLGVNKLAMRGYQNWDQKAIDRAPVSFKGFDWEHDLLDLRNIFPQVRLMSPLLSENGATPHFGGNDVPDGIKVLGVNEQFFAISNLNLLVGHGFSPYQVEGRTAVCVIGNDLSTRLFASTPPIGQILYVTSSDTISYACQVIGVLKPITSNQDSARLNLQLYLPYSFFQLISSNWWNSQIHEVSIQVNPQADVEQTGKMIRNYFRMKYGKSGQFNVDSNAVLIAQMKKFLNLFAIMLAAIAFISLLVGGIGITNMMLVSVSERFKEIGLRKAVGATDLSIRMQFLLESVALCAIAGVVGIIIGFGSYEMLIYGASKVISKLNFEWTVDPTALSLSVLSIVGVGISSGLVPALKAEKLEVIEALRNE